MHTWTDPFENPFMAIWIVAKEFGRVDALRESFMNLCTWNSFDEPTFLDDMLQEIAGATNIVCQKLEEGWVATLDEDFGK